jgi:hypothetical protein
LRPIVWGVIVTVVGGFFWMMFGWVFGLAFMSARGGLPPFYQALSLMGFLVMSFGIPAGIVAEFVSWCRGKKAPKALTPQAYHPSAVSIAVYCSQCGGQVRPGALFCDRCGTRL